MSFHKDFVKVNGDLIEIGIMVKPIQGKANLVIIKQIAKHLGVPKSKIRLVAGAKSQDKVIEVVS
ncbi:MAG TPA: DUF167 domain-containing protein [Candidatus Nitrosotalea sp.]|nr:DUF167 domain-containing protein [Candidatus Nitrosotalea sp.]